MLHKFILINPFKHLAKETTKVGQEGHEVEQ